MTNFKKSFGIFILTGLTIISTVDTSRGQERKSSEQVHSLKNEGRPNIIFILADDLGWGGLQSYNPGSVIPTPNSNILAEDGMVFTNAHTTSSVCTPSRYSLLTGRYPWRTRLKDGVLWPPDKPLIKEGELTLGSLLKKQGYYTAAVGKWHLGLGWVLEEQEHMLSGKKKHVINFDKPLTQSPNSVGFDFSYIIPGSLDMPPYCYIKNGKVEQKPTRQAPKEEFGRAGLAVAGLKPEDVLPHFTRVAVQVIKDHAHSNDDDGAPLFLYFALPSPHTPIAPGKDFQGKTQMGKYGDYVYESDYMIGEIMKALKKNHMYRNTLLIVSSDNGASPMGAREAIANGHDVNGPWRGRKGQIWEGGSRVPFIAHWPGHVPAGTTQDARISLADMMATFASLTGAALPEDAGADSYNALPAFLDPDLKNPVGGATVVESIAGYFAILQGSWKAVFAAGSGAPKAWGHPAVEEALKLGLPRVQLYNLSNDKGEVHNLQDKYPEKVWSFNQLLLHIIDRGRSTPGPRLQNWEGKNRWPQVNWETE